MEVDSATKEMSFACVHIWYGFIDAFCECCVLCRAGACLVDVFSLDRPDGQDKGDVVVGVGFDTHEEDALGMVQAEEVTFHGCHLCCWFETQVHLCVSVDVEVWASGLAICVHVSIAMVSAEGDLAAVGIDAAATNSQ